MSLHELFDPRIFYSRQIALQELGRAGQEKLRGARVAVVGVGGLGSVSALYLALAGVGFLRLIDQDTVEMHNIHRQVLYSLKDIRYPKVEAAADRIRQINPEVKVESIPENIREENADELIKGVDCVVDGLDNMRTRYLINRVCVKDGIPYVFGGAIGFEGNISVFHPPETPCLECVMPNLKDSELPTCETRGVIGFTTGIIGAIQAIETVKLLIGVEESLKGKMMISDFKSMEFVKIDIYKRQDCPVCTGKATEIPADSKKPVWLCGQKTVNINPTNPLKLEPDTVHHMLKNHFKVLLKTSLLIVLKHSSGAEVSLFRNGRALIKNVENEEEAKNIYNDVIKGLKQEPSHMPT